MLLTVTAETGNHMAAHPTPATSPSVYVYTSVQIFVGVNLSHTSKAHSYMCYCGRPAGITVTDWTRLREIILTKAHRLHNNGMFVG